ncbi:serine/threonine protein kinase [Kitasatospora sp. MAP12-15]|uniref:serine/threonine-protein kinase n=1 Tax=unclassified Kitasatospora TaxID=2633591 RepID=UPI00247724C1|nr:serine/threonine-protein kinase [Kitasatospora sp. MAP12-44]MDH6112783.1 serine/threonine protein kinase [Kitasatospora sp. MAP12-44]
MKAGMLLAERYLLVGELGRGGFGIVWEAYDQRLGRQVAVKTLRHRGLSNANDIRRMVREVEILARLSHPNIVMVFDQGEADDGPERFSYLVMELLDGPTLAGMVATEPPDLTRALAWGQQLCAALAAAHAARVIHRDVKPENIMIIGPARDMLKVLDFGIAQIGDNVDSLTTEGSVIGSARYLAPERWRGEPGTVRSDLYALGCVLYELFTGKRPFTSTSQVGLMNQHLDQPRVRPAGLPVELGELLVELLATDPADRPVDADEVRRRLQRAADGIRELRRRADAAWDLAEGERVPDAVGKLRELVPEFARAFGPADGRTLRTCHDLAVSLARAGRSAEAYCLLAELLPAAVTALGAEHRDVADIERRLSRFSRPEQPCREGVLAALLAG